MLWKPVLRVFEYYVYREQIMTSDVSESVKKRLFTDECYKRGRAFVRHYDVYLPYKFFIF